jgi:23S rRNA pseudouridine2605 synthase
MSDDLQPDANAPENEPVLDETQETAAPVADEPVTEAATEEETETAEAPAAEAEAPDDAESAEAETGDEADDEADDEAETTPRPPAKLERLQKILAQAGIASRRRAEELIEQGRVQVNGKIVTEMGTKADAGRDHIRVDGKLLHGAERLRYFVLNKPRGYVTTVKDPEGRPTVMQFFEKMRERLYPVGRLDYMSEGLLVVTNDGELANRLTKASSGVEKTYLVKVAGQPTEAELDVLRGGVSIERGKPGSTKVRTSPARIRQVRQGDNPWYEVVLIEGRNRELRKMFEEVGHFVEKIRRVGYGPLVLDQEPGNLRELEPEELEALRRVAEGKLRTPKSKDVRRRNLLDAQLPTLRPRPSRPRPARPAETGSAAAPGEFRPRKPFGAKEGAPGPSRTDDRTQRPSPSRFAPGSASGRPASRPAGRPAWKKDDRSPRPPARFTPGSASESRPSASRPYSAKPATGRPYGDKPAGRTYGAKPASNRPTSDRPAWSKPAAEGRPPYKRPAAPRREAPMPTEDLEPRKPSHLQIDPIGPDTPSTSYPRTSHPGPGRSNAGRPRFERPSGGPSNAGRPFRAEGGMSRPFTTSTGKPRAGGARPSSKPGKPSGRSYGAGSKSGPGFKRSSDAPSTGYKRPSAGSSAGPARRPFRRDAGEGSYAPRPSTGSGPRPSRPYTPREGGTSDFRPTSAKPYPNSASRAERKTGAGWKPKPSFGGPGKPPSGARSKPWPGGSAKSGFKGKPGGKRPGGAPGGKRRG